MKKVNREFKSIDVMAGGERNSNINQMRADDKKGFYKDQMHMPCSGMNPFGCKGRRDY